MNFKLTTLALTMGAASVAQAAPFTPGNLLIERVGAAGSSAALTNAATAVFVDEYTTAGTLVQSVALPTSGTNQLTASGTATSEGLLNLSANGSNLLLPGYNAPVGTGSIASSAASAWSREAGVMSLSGSVSATASFGALLGNNNFRSVASADGQNIYGAGATGIAYVSAGGGAVQLATTNARGLEIAGGQLYYSTDKGTSGIYALGTGLPTAVNPVATLVAAVSTPNAFVFADLSSSVSGLDTLFVTTNATSGSNPSPATSGLFKFTKNASGNWVAQGSILGTVLQGLAVSVTNGQATLYATGNADASSTLYSYTDTGFGNNLAGSLNALTVASANTVFRGLDILPVPEPSSYSIALAGLLVVGSLARRRQT